VVEKREREEEEVPISQLTIVTGWWEMAEGF
jgi:hypothetical protein